jgi:hypothetical protein
MVWKKERLDRGSDVFEKGYKPGGTRLVYERDQLLKKVRELSLKVDFLKKGFTSKEHRLLVNPNLQLAEARQC